jgi:hypothetical protein
LDSPAGQLEPAAEEAALNVYSATAASPAIAAACDALGTRGGGFEVLMGPPYYRPPILFIGYQPGTLGKNAPQGKARALENGWASDRCHYAFESWKLAAELRSIYTENYLKACVGKNAIYVRAPDIDVYCKQVPKAVRSDVLAFCMEQNRKLCDALQPQTIVVIGLGTLGLFGRDETALKSEKGHALACSGRVFGRPAIGVVHLTGARLTAPSKRRLARYLRQMAPGAPEGGWADNHGEFASE